MWMYGMCMPIDCPTYEFRALRYPMYNDFTSSYVSLRAKANRPLMYIRLKQMMIELYKRYQNSRPACMGERFNKVDHLHQSRSVRSLQQPLFNTVTYVCIPAAAFRLPNLSAYMHLFVHTKINRWTRAITLTCCIHMSRVNCMYTISSLSSLLSKETRWHRNTVRSSIQEVLIFHLYQRYETRESKYFWKPQLHSRVTFIHIAFAFCNNTQAHFETVLHKNTWHIIRITKKINNPTVFNKCKLFSHSASCSLRTIYSVQNTNNALIDKETATHFVSLSRVKIVAAHAAWPLLTDICNSTFAKYKQEFVGGESNRNCRQRLQESQIWQEHILTDKYTGRAYEQQY